MSFDLQTAHSVTEIDPTMWDRLAEGRPFASHDWYRFGETVLADESRVYFLLSQDGEPVARATFRLARREPLPISSDFLRALLNRLISRWPLMMCQSLLANTSGLILPDPPVRELALKALANAALAHARKEGISFVLFPHLGPQQAEQSGWPETFVSTQVPGPGTQLKIDWPDFESYIGSRRKSVRKDYRRHGNRADDLGVVITTHPRVTRLDKAMTLIRNVEDRHGSSRNPWARPMLEHADMVEATWLTAEIEDRLVGCGLILGEKGTRFLALLGLDYDVKYVYFQLVYGALRAVIEEGVKVLRGGGGAYKTKTRLGFEVESDNHAVFAGARGLLHRAGHWVATRNT